MSPEQMEAESEACEAIQVRIRRQAMIYQAEDKYSLADKTGVPFETLAHMPFDEWMAFRRQHEEST